MTAAHRAGFVVLLVLLFFAFEVRFHEVARTRRVWSGPPGWTPIVREAGPADLARTLPHCAFLVQLGPARDSPLTLTSASDGVRFDIDGDGEPEQVSWPAPGAALAFLAIDRDGNGWIDSGRELVGDATGPAGASAPRALLALVDESGVRRSAIITPPHPVFDRLLLWADVNHDGRSGPGELQRAADVLSGIGLGFVPRHITDGLGNDVWRQGFVWIAPGDPTPGRSPAPNERPMYEVCLAVREDR